MTKTPQASAHTASIRPCRPCAITSFGAKRADKTLLTVIFSMPSETPPTVQTAYPTKGTLCCKPTT
ncbi:TPA: hypothetical protein WI541_000253 [Neisseria meningitidis]